MTEQEQNSQKTVVAFVAGLLVGGLLVWVFSAGPTAEAPNTTDDDQATAETHDDEMTDNNEGTASDIDLSVNSSDTTTSTLEMEVGEGKLVVDDQPAGNVVELASATFPSDEGWVGVRDYSAGQMGNILGVARFSKEQGLIPTEVNLLRPTEAGMTYAVVFFTENGDMEFSLATDVQVGSVSTTFVAE